ncbi:hypothetical protein [Streptomyces yerevanensis]|uniref:hypothetical protein n=1 Tax=Streptomyces yerevanensis TaxID=66378 RepID=UPI00052434B5|nr:hypothetical protein [Streptomyces yerevanensis]
MTRHELELLLLAYDDAMTELDRANLEAYMIKRRARLAEVEVDPEEEAAIQARRRTAGQGVRATSEAVKAAGWIPYRPSSTPSGRQIRLRNTQMRFRNTGRAA